MKNRYLCYWAVAGIIEGQLIAFIEIMLLGGIP
jgi:hypothetical protein